MEELFERNRNNRILKSLVAKVKATSEYVAVGLIRGEAHGYQLEFELIQTKAGTFLAGSSSTFGESLVNQELELNLVEELARLKSEHPRLRVRLPWKADRGRYGTIFLASEEGEEWLVCQPGLIGQPYEDSAINRLYRTVFGP